MGIEIREVPANWEHPQKLQQRMNSQWEQDYIPLYDMTFEEAAWAWLEEMALWLTGEHESQDVSAEELARLQAKYPGSFLPEDFAHTVTAYSEYCGDFPDREYYRPDWTEPADHYQIYETVSEGTPISPVFATKKELEAWLVESEGYSPETAAKFVKWAYAPSMVMVVSEESSVLKTGIESLELL